MLEQALMKAIEKYSTSPQLKQMLEYCVVGGGKRVRPTLCLLTAKMLGVEQAAAMPFAVSLELIHSYSLVHDDLPAMDNDDFRRGKASCHKRFSEADAILTGDALLTMAALVLSEVEGEQEAKKEIFSSAMTMVEGQRLDLSDPKRTEDLYRKKTGALILAGILAAARLAKCNQMQYDNLYEFGDSLGLLFQLTDDVIDNEQNATAVSDRIEQLNATAASALNEFGEEATPLRMLLDAVTERKA
ncbi:MAG: polyprenyl synthetase family protein [Eubacteriales bacterium]|nr:polyprenyl synthetase family protein [Eubacteriales bacterium]